MGEQARIGSRLGLWYASGAAHWCNLSPDLLWPQDISAINLPEYFAKFDYVAEYVTENDYMTDVTSNSRRESVTSWYASGLLHLGGFFLGARPTPLHVLFLRPVRADQIEGYVWTGDRLLRFEPREDGDQAFVTCVCPVEPYPPVNRFGLPRFGALYLPEAGPQGWPAASLPGARRERPRSAIVTSLLSRQEFQARRAALSAECRFLDLVWGRLSAVSHAALLKRLRETDPGVRFYAGPDNINVPRLATTNTGRAVIDLEAIQPYSVQAAVRGTRTRVVKTPPEPWSYAAFVPMSQEHAFKGGWIYVRAKVLRGEVGFGVTAPDHSTFIARQFLGKAPAAETIYLPVRAFAEGRRLVVLNGGHVGSSEAIIEEVGALAPAGSAPARTGRQ